MRHLVLACWISLLASHVAVAAPTVRRPTARKPAVRTPTVHTPPPIGVVAGTWRGHAVREGAQLDLSMRFSREQGKLLATMSCPDMLLLEVPIEGAQHIGKHVRFHTPDEHPVRFVGVLEGDSIRGTATLSAVPGVAPADRDAPSIRFALGRVAAPPAPPYATREVHFASGALQLAATLHVPAGGERRAGIVLLSGSSSKRRGDLAFYADHFARAGLTALVFDKRGTGESPGDYGAATYEQLADDAAAAVEFLRRQPGVDAARVGVWGLSQGALLAPMVAARVPEVRFLVAVSAPGIPPGESVAYQDSIRLAAKGFDAADIRRMVTIQRRMQAWLADGRDQAELSALLAEASSTTWRKASSLPVRLPAGTALNGWYWRGRALDPESNWRAVHVPVLAVYGAADELMLARPNAKAVERALKKGGNEDFTVRTFPAANHVLRTLPEVARGPWDWPRAAPGYMELVTTWVLERTQP